MTETSSPTLQARREQVQRPQPDKQAQMFGHRQHAEHELFTDLRAVQEGYRWSGVGKVPPLGARVRVRANSLGLGTVRAYFLSDGGDGGLRFLGVAALLDDPPQWYIEQRERQVREGRARGDHAHLFGVEVELV
jgi:hypothetical protein